MTERSPFLFERNRRLEAERNAGTKLQKADESALHARMQCSASSVRMIDAAIAARRRGAVAAAGGRYAPVIRR
jgi:hypothetical protein